MDAAVKPFAPGNRERERKEVLTGKPFAIVKHGPEIQLSRFSGNIVLLDTWDALKTRYIQRPPVIM